jgi:hypothetical protein
MKFSILVGLGMAVVLAQPAEAAGNTKMFPLSGSLPKSLRGAQAEMSVLIAKSMSAEMANVPVEDAAELKECDITSNTCLETITKSVGATRIVFGKIERKQTGIAIELTTFDLSAGEHHQKFVLQGETSDELVSSLSKRLDRDRGGSDDDKPAKSKKPKKIASKEQAGDDKPPRDADQPAGTITTGTWSLIIAGGVGIVAGAGVYISANSLKDQINSAPTNNRQDIDRLLALERAGKARVAVGIGLMAVGGIVGTVGTIRAVMQHSAPPKDRPVIDVVPEVGGASVLFTKEWR